MNDRQQTIAVYDNKAKELADYFNGIGRRKTDIDKALSFINKPNPKVIEIGCGNGRDAEEILKHTNDYVGMDVSTGMIALAKKAIPTATFEVADIATYNFPPNTDIIFSFASLLHSDKHEVSDVISRAYEALSPNGIFYISLKYDTYQKKIKSDEYGERVFYFYTPEDIKELADKRFATVHEDTQVIGDTKWFTIALQRFNGSNS